MKVSRIIVALLFVLAFSHAAIAQQGPGTGKPSAPEDFKDKQARILKMIEDRKAHLDKAKACVEAAKTDEDLQKCRPERPMGMGPGGMRRGGGEGGPRGQWHQMPTADQQQ